MDREKIPYKVIEKILKISRDDQKYLLKFYAKQSIEIQLNLEKKKKKTFHFLREKYTDINHGILSYCAHLLSIKSHYSFQKKFSTKKFDTLTLEEIRNISMIKLQIEDEKSYLKSSNKRSKLLHYWSVVKLYRGKKPKPLSFVKISEKLKKHYNFSVSHNTIAVLWREIELGNK